MQQYIQSFLKNHGTLGSKICLELLFLRVEILSAVEEIKMQLTLCARTNRSSENFRLKKSCVVSQLVSSPLLSSTHSLSQQSPTFGKNGPRRNAGSVRGGVSFTAPEKLWVSFCKLKMSLSLCPPKPRESLLHNYSTTNAVMFWYGRFSNKKVHFWIKCI